MSKTVGGPARAREGVALLREPRRATRDADHKVIPRLQPEALACVAVGRS